MILPYFS